MLFPFLPVRLHGWLDEVATLSYLAVAFAFGFEGAGFWLLLLAALVHFTNTRLTDYPQGQLKAYTLATHAKIELTEGLALLGAAALLASSPELQRILLAVLGGSQLLAALTAQTRWPPQSSAS
jgi:hypothetical protein